MLKGALLIAFFALLFVDVLDVVSMLLGFHLGFVESNPLGIYFIGILGPIVGLVLLKALSLGIIGIVILLVLHTKEHLDDEAALTGLVIVLGIGVFVLSNNFTLLGYV